MALPVNSIGTNSFMSLLGQLEPPRNQMEIDQRPGVSGTEILHLRDRGVPFRLISIVDCASIADAHQQYMLYRAGALNSSVGALAVIQSDYDTTSEGYTCKVLDV